MIATGVEGGQEDVRTAQRRVQECGSSVGEVKHRGGVQHPAAFADDPGATDTHRRANRLR
jgi:hypothetical protein